ncbi:unnamed protein product [Calicophoron daubneyi]|uniref:Uncharacterized protein n=1 Tax=Calicophoron daubneyi TaxID=300641 RepID=A0AAV2TQW4_CALDB
MALTSETMNPMMKVQRYLESNSLGIGPPGNSNFANRYPQPDQQHCVKQAGLVHPATHEQDLGHRIGKNEVSHLPNTENEIPIEECWLYKPPRRTTNNAPIQSVKKWIRDVFDAPDSPFRQTRRDLLIRLEAILASGGPIAAYKFGGSVPTLNFLPSGHYVEQAQHVTENLPEFNGRVGFPSVGSSDSLSTNLQPLERTHSLRFDSMGQMKRPKYSLPPQKSTAQRLSNGPSGSTSYLSQSLGVQSMQTLTQMAKSGSFDELERTASKGDVQEIARLQEDTLKADVAAIVAAAAGRRGSQNSLASLGHRTPDGSLSHLPSAPESPHSSNPQLASQGYSLSTVGRAPTFESLSTAGLPSTPVVSDVPCVMRPPAQNPSPQGPLRFPSQSGNPPVCTVDPGQTFTGNSGMFVHSGPKYQYSTLTQKPFVPSGLSQSRGELNSTTGFPQNSQPPPIIPPFGETRNQFGFRSIRKTSNQIGASKPPPMPGVSVRRPMTQNSTTVPDGNL